MGILEDAISGFEARIDAKDAGLSEAERDANDTRIAATNRLEAMQTAVYGFERRVSERTDFLSQRLSIKGISVRRTSSGEARTQDNRYRTSVSTTFVLHIHGKDDYSSSVEFLCDAATNYASANVPGTPVMMRGGIPGVGAPVPLATIALDQVHDGWVDSALATWLNQQAL